MAIDILRDHTIKAMPKNVALARSSRVTTTDAQAATTTATPQNYKPSTDDVVLTEKAKNLAKAAELAKDADGIDYAKVAELKQQYEKGELDFDYERIAAKMLASDSDISSFLS